MSSLARKAAIPGIFLALILSLWLPSSGSADIQRFYKSWIPGFDSPWGLEVNRFGDVYVSTSNGSSAVWEYSADGELLDSYPLSGSVGGVRDVTVDRQGYVYVANLFDDTVTRYEPGGGVVDQWGSNGSGPGEFDQLIGLAVAPGGLIYALDFLGNRVQAFTATGGF